jgi:DNA-binding CsgD family transcriptional regulator
MNKSCPICGHLTSTKIIDNITPRQKEVLDLLIEGCKSREISERLGIELRTVKAHLARMYRMVDVDRKRSSQIQLIKKVWDETHETSIREYDTNGKGKEGNGISSNGIYEQSDSTPIWYD